LGFIDPEKCPVPSRGEGSGTPPLGVFLEVGIKPQFWPNILLTLLGYKWQAKSGATEGLIGRASGGRGTLVFREVAFVIAGLGEDVEQVVQGLEIVFHGGGEDFLHLVIAGDKRWIVAAQVCEYFGGR
jgi:hypothetical protein